MIGVSICPPFKIIKIETTMGTECHRNNPLSLAGLQAGHNGAVQRRWTHATMRSERDSLAWVYSANNSELCVGSFALSWRTKILKSEGLFLMIPFGSPMQKGHCSHILIDLQFLFILFRLTSHALPLSRLRILIWNLVELRAVAQI